VRDVSWGERPGLVQLGGALRAGGRGIAACPVPPSSPSSGECPGSAEVGVRHQPKHCPASAEDQTSGISRSGCPPSAETLSGLSRGPNVRHQPE
jgi:hypothetical protein